MPAVFTKCPVTGQPIDTGVDIDDVSFVRLPSFLGRVFCPHCQIDHEWTKDKAWMEDQDQPSS
jgi:hypothetical protein